MANSLLFENLIDGDEDTGLLHITKTIVDGGTEKLHRRTQTHVGINKRRNIITQLANFTVQDAIVCLEVIFCKDGSQITLWSIQFQRFHREYEVLLVIEMLLEEIENHVAATTDVRRIHRHLAEEIFYFRIENRQSAQTIPEIVESKDALGVGTHILIFERNEGTAQLYGIRHILLEELVGEMEHVAGCQLRLSLLIELPVPTQEITVTADNLIGFRIPDYQLLVTVVTKVELIKIHRFARSASRFAESDFTKSTNLFQHIRRIICRNDVNLVMALIGHSQLLVGCKLALQELTVNRLDDFFFHITLLLCYDSTISLI